MSLDSAAVASRLAMYMSGMFHKLRSEVAEPSTGMVAVFEDVAVVEAMEENMTVEAGAHCMCMVAAVAVEEESMVESMVAI